MLDYPDLDFDDWDIENSSEIEARFGVGSDLDFEFEDIDSIPISKESTELEVTTESHPSIVLAEDDPTPFLSFDFDPFFTPSWPVDEWKSFVQILSSKLGVFDKEPVPTIIAEEMKDGPAQNPHECEDWNAFEEQIDQKLGVRIFL